MTAYYNENDPKKAAWLRELIARDLVAPGDVDERSIEDVRPDELAGYAQCHFFAGIGGWSYALRLAGWADDTHVWTGSCPCQPFSPAGKGEGFADERHLWPAWFHLIEQCAPHVIFGEQSSAALEWIDLVCADLEACGYTTGTLDLPAASVGAPHKRQRLWFVAHAEHAERRTLDVHREDGRHGEDGRRQEAHGVTGARSEVCDMADSQCGAGERHGPELAGTPEGVQGASQQRERLRDQPGHGRTVGVAHDANCAGSQGHRRHERVDGAKGREAEERHGAATSLWDSCEWIYCTDGVYRPVEPGTFPLAHGIPARVVRLSGFGNAIVPQLAAQFIMAYGTIR